MNSYLSNCLLAEIITGYREQKIEQLLVTLCDKIDKYDVFIKAFLPENNRKKRVLGELDKLYEKFPSKESRPPLFGIPIAVKDIFHVDGFITKAGSNLPEDALQGKESKAVTKLKEAGAIIFGKTVTTEFAYYHPGPTVNPNNFRHTPGGSSSGSAASVAAGFAPLALGTQTIGSISRPASYCGVIGFKPSHGRISADGVIPFSYSADHVGFFTQDIKGGEIVASILCDKWKNVVLSNKPVLGIPSDKYLSQADKKVVDAFEFEVKKLKRIGFDIVRTDLFDDIENINLMHKELIAYEFAQVHKNWYEKYKKHYRKTTRELIEFGKIVPREKFEKAKTAQLTLRKKIENYQNKYGIDMWISPSATSFAPKGLGSTGNPAMNLPWTNAQVPTLSIPVALSEDGLPLGMQFAGKYYEDEKLYKMVLIFMNYKEEK